MIENVFIEMLCENLDDLRTGKLPKGKFVGKYIQAITAIDKQNAFRYKRPQVVGDGKEPENNWLDYLLGLSEQEFEYFKLALNEG